MKKRLFGRDRGRPRRRGGRSSRAPTPRCRSSALGCVVRDWRVDGPSGSLPMVLGFPRLEDYVHHSRSHGAIVGRVANRTAGVALHARRARAMSSTAERGRAPPARRAATGSAAGSGRWRPTAPRGRCSSPTRAPTARRAIPGAVDFAVTLPARGAAARSARCAGVPGPADADQPRQPQLLQPRRRRDGEGPPALGRRAGLHADRRRADPDGRDPPGRGDAARLLASRARDRRHASSTINLVLDAGPRPKRSRRRGRSARGPGVRLELWTDEPGLQVFDASEMTIATPGHDGQTLRAVSPGSASRRSTSPTACTSPDWPSIIRTPEAPVLPAAGGGDRRRAGREAVAHAGCRPSAAEVAAPFASASDRAPARSGSSAHTSAGGNRAFDADRARDEAAAVCRRSRGPASRSPRRRARG